MREIKFRQPVWDNGKITGWHYWGFKDGLYQPPINQHESYQFTNLKDRNGTEIYEGDICKLAILGREEMQNPAEALQVVIEFKNAAWGFRRIYPELVHGDDRGWRAFYDSEDKELWNLGYFEVIRNTPNRD